MRQFSKFRLQLFDYFLKFYQIHHFTNQLKIIFSKFFRKKKREREIDFFANANQKAHCNSTYEDFDRICARRESSKNLPFILWQQSKQKSKIMRRTAKNWQQKNS